MNLYKQNETLGITFFQVPMVLFANSKYAAMSLAAKMAYGLMLNRIQLSSINGWVNENKEVYIIYTREQMAAQLNLSYKSIVAVFKELKQYGLIEERRRGNGLPNHIYLSRIEVTDQEAKEYCEASRCEEMTGQPDQTYSGSDVAMPDSEDRDVKSSEPDVSKCNIKTCKNDGSGCVNSTGLDVKKLHPSYIDFSYKEFSKNNGSNIKFGQSVRQLGQLSTKSELELEEILNRCELSQFPEDEAPVLSEAVTRLYYSNSIRIGEAILPQSQIHAKLKMLDDQILRAAYDKVHANNWPVKNSMGYIMTVIYNAIMEKDGDLMVDPYLNFLHNGKGVQKC